MMKLASQRFVRLATLACALFLIISNNAVSKESFTFFTYHNKPPYFVIEVDRNHNEGESLNSIYDTLC